MCTVAWSKTRFYLWSIVQVILFEIDCAVFYTNLLELFFQFISWTNWVNSGKFMDNCWISCQVMADMEKIYDDLIIINLYLMILFDKSMLHQSTENYFGSWAWFGFIQLHVLSWTGNLHHIWLTYWKCKVL